MKTQTSFTVMSELRAGRGLAYVSRITHGGVEGTFSPPRVLFRGDRLCQKKQRNIR